MSHSPEGVLQALTPDDFGIADPAFVTRHDIHTQAPDGRDVSLQTLVWRRTENQAMHDALQEIPNRRRHQQGTEQLVMISGFGANAKDWPVGYPSFGQTWKTVVGIDHPDAPSSTIEPHDKPLNAESFQPSGAVIFEAIRQLSEEKILKPGEVTLVGYSTGASVAMEAVREDILHSETSGTHRFIKNLVLFSPAGILENSDIVKGVGAAMKPYMAEYFRQKHSNTVQQRRTFAEIKTRIREIWLNPTWRHIRIPNVAFELVEYVTSLLPVHALKAHFHRIWPNQLPHIHPGSPTYSKNMELVKHNTTQLARQTITNTNVLVFLMDGDGAVPLDGFLTPEERDEPEAKEDFVLAAVKRAFPNNTNTAVSIAYNSHHITPRTDTFMFLGLIDRRLKLWKKQ